MTLRNFIHTSKFAISPPFKFCFFAKFYSHATSCALCAKAKAAYKPFDADGAQRKAKEETARRVQARKTKQRIDAVTPYKSLGKISDDLHPNNQNNWLERRAWPP